MSKRVIKKSFFLVSILFCFGIEFVLAQGNLAINNGGGEFDLISDEDFLKKTPEEIARIYQIKEVVFKEAVNEACKKKNPLFDCQDFDVKDCFVFGEILKDCPLKVAEIKELTFDIESENDYKELLSESPASVSLKDSKKLESSKKWPGLVFIGFLIIAILVVGVERIYRRKNK